MEVSARGAGNEHEATPRQEPASALLAVIVLPLSVCVKPVRTASRPLWSTESTRSTSTVADMDRSVDFYSRVLDFQKVSDTEVAGELRAPGGSIWPAHAGSTDAAGG